MIKPTDLRIGNWVDIPGKGFTQILTGHDIDQAASEEYNPIPTTRDLLIRLGFTQHGASDIYEIKRNMFGYNVASKRITIGHPGNTLWHWLGSHIDHVHQLQNIFYCIVGYDLTFA